MPENKTDDGLPVINDCHGCGVCCRHMGYPAFMLPREKATAAQIDSEERWQKLLAAGWTHQELLDGHPGESYWHRLPDDLRIEWQEFVNGYQKTGELDERCFWLDEETQLCKHHEHRPQVCRDFEIGCTECRQWRKHFEID